MNKNNNNNNNINIEQRQEITLKRSRWHDSFYTRLLSNPNNNNNNNNNSIPSTPTSSQISRLDERDLVKNIVPSVTVVLEGRSICQRVNLHCHASYYSLGKALRQMFKDILNFEEINDEENNNKEEFDVFNVIPGHIVAYEDLENDLLLAGDLHWKDFVRVAKRIRILPVKSKLRSTKH